MTSKIVFFKLSDYSPPHANYLPLNIVSFHLNFVLSAGKVFWLSSIFLCALILLFFCLERWYWQNMKNWYTNPGERVEKNIFLSDYPKWEWFKTFWKCTKIKSCSNAANLRNKYFQSSCSAGKKFFINWWKVVLSKGVRTRRSDETSTISCNFVVAYIWFLDLTAFVMSP